MHWAENQRAAEAADAPDGPAPVMAAPPAVRSPVLLLQRTVGNRATARLLARQDGGTDGGVAAPAASGRSAAQELFGTLREPSIRIIQALVGAPVTGRRDEATASRLLDWLAAQGVARSVDVLDADAMDVILRALLRAGGEVQALTLAADAAGVPLAGLNLGVSATTSGTAPTIDWDRRQVLFGMEVFRDRWPDVSRHVGAGVTHGRSEIREVDAARQANESQGLPATAITPVLRAIGVTGSAWTMSATAALRQWQATAGLAASRGRFDDATADRIIRALVATGVADDANNALHIVARHGRVGLYGRSVSFDATVPAASPWIVDVATGAVRFGSAGMTGGYAQIRTRLLASMARVAAEGPATTANAALLIAPDAVRAMRRRLGAPPGTGLDAACTRAIMAFQERRGLAVDGRLAGATLDAVVRDLESVHQETAALRLLVGGHAIATNGFVVAFDRNVVGETNAIDRPRAGAPAAGRVRFGPPLLALSTAARLAEIRDVLTRALLYVAAPAMQHAGAGGPLPRAGAAQSSETIPAGRVTVTTGGGEAVTDQWFELDFQGPHARQAFWIQFIAIRIAGYDAANVPIVVNTASLPAGGQFMPPPVGAAPLTPGPPAMIPASPLGPGNERWAVDAVGMRAPNYDARGWPGQHFPTGGAHWSTASRTRMMDRPAGDETIAQALFATSGVVRVDEEEVFDEYLVRGLNILYGNRMTVWWQWTAPPMTPTDGSRRPGTHGPRDRLLPSQHTALVGRFPAFNYFRH